MPLDRRANTGFALITTLVAVAIVLAGLAAGLAVYKSRSDASARDAMVQRQVSDMEAIATSLDAYMRWSGTAWTEDQVILVPLATLRDNGLPMTVGEHGGSADVTPWAQSYIVRAVRRSDGTRRGVIYSTGPFAPGLLRRSGTRRLRLTVLVAAVAAALTDRHLSAGAMTAGSTVVAGSGGGFTKDLADYVGFLAQPTAAVLVGFPDLTPSSDGPTSQPPGGTFHTAGRCGLARGGSWGDGVCPAGYKTITRYPHCGRFNANPVPFSAKSSPAGMVVFGEAFYVDASMDRLRTCVGEWCMGDWQPQWAYKSTHTDTVVLLQGAIIDQYTCRNREWGFPPAPPHTSGGLCVKHAEARRFGDDQCVAEAFQNTNSSDDVLCCR